MLFFKTTNENTQDRESLWHIYKPNRDWRFVISLLNTAQLVVLLICTSSFWFIEWVWRSTCPEVTWNFFCHSQKSRKEEEWRLRRWETRWRWSSANSEGRRQMTVRKDREHHLANKRQHCCMTCTFSPLNKLWGLVGVWKEVLVGDTKVGANGRRRMIKMWDEKTGHQPNEGRN